MADETKKIKERMEKLTQESGSEEGDKPQPFQIPEGGGPMTAERGPDPRGEGSKDRDVAHGPKSISQKQAVAEEKIARAKAEDTEDTREETSGDERHDLIAGKELNIPPTIQQERLRNGQNPGTGEPWTREERKKYDREIEQSRQAHAKAVRESEQRMRKEQAEAQIQPVPHVPTAFLTDEQKDEMQKAQDSGKGPVAQAAARDAADPEVRGRREAQELENR